MTCIFAVNDGDRLAFVSDRRTSNGYNVFVRPEPKAIRRNGVLLGGAGLAGLCHISTRQFPVKEYKGYANTQEYMHDFTEGLVKYLTELGWLQDKTRMLQSETNINSGLLVGVAGDVFKVVLPKTTPIHFVQVPVPYAIGCGDELCLGAWLALKDSDGTFKSKIKKVFKIISDINSGCDSNFDIVYE